MNISVIGLGKLGSPLAAVLASKGHRVIGVDVDDRYVQALNAGRPPVPEPGLAELVAAHRAKLSATANYDEAVGQTEATFVIVPTPSGEDGTFSLKFVLPAIDAIGKALRSKSGYHLVVVTSTVMPGHTHNQIRPALEAAAGKRLGKGLGLCYSPEFIALGSVIRDMLNPDFFLIGESDPRAGDLLASIYHTACDNQAPVRRMGFVNAELTKIAVNTFVTTKISYANTLARICERLPGADVDVVTGALGADSRIGSKYLKGALGYGGPCFPRDNIAFSSLARQLEIDAVLPQATDLWNRRQIGSVADLVVEKLVSGGTVGVLGLAYKADTNVVEESQGLALCAELARRNVDVIAYDPAAIDNAKRALGDRIRFATSIEECAKSAQVIAVTTPWPQFRTLSAESLDRSRGRPVIIDCWRTLPHDQLAAVADIVVLGRGPAA